jgi:hypothetical protein
MDMPVDHRLLVGALALMCVVLAGCGDTRVQTEHTMHLDMEPLELRLALDGPIQLMMEGPSVTYDGTFVSEEQLEWVDEKETTAEWVRAVFGEPDVITPLSDGTEIWRWSFRPTRAQGELLHIFGTEKEPEPSHITTMVRIRDGVVIEKRRG